MGRHFQLTGNDLHENKGVADATNGEVATAQGGATVWKKLTAANFAASALAFQNQFCHFVQRKAINVAGGTLTANTWTNRVWTHRLDNDFTPTWNDANITLDTGDYIVEAWAVGYNCGSHQLRLRTTAGTTLLTGITSRATATDDHVNTTGVATLAQISGRFTLGASRTIQLQHNCDSTQAGNGQGLAGGFGTEQYADLMIWKVG